ncbi:class I SAM-dependent methyltransferase [Candidatus Sumerlaeota bacterium]|nr:class I SAM-dependent methyltransferase [Candidatus Sumerlaeota bacterium]
MRLSARLLLASNRVLRPRRRAHATDQAYFDHTFTVARGRAPVFARHVDLGGKRLLDIGCGLGAKAIFYAKETPVAEVVGVDLSERRIGQARAFAECAGVGEPRLRFEVGDASGMPFENESFDLLLSEDMIEHVADVPGFLAECRRVLRPGGSILMRGGPLYFSPWGAHLYYQFGMPWVTLLLSRSAIREASASLPEPQGVFLSMSLAEEIEQLEGLNRLTPRRLTRLVDEAGFERRLWQWGPRKMRFLGCLPLIGPLFTASITAVLVKS